LLLGFGREPLRYHREKLNRLTESLEDLRVGHG
jgi:hypothetical protein